jgi:hypothetical protein
VIKTVILVTVLYLRTYICLKCKPLGKYSPRILRYSKEYCTALLFLPESTTMFYTLTINLANSFSPRTQNRATIYHHINCSLADKMLLLLQPTFQPSKRAISAAPHMSPGKSRPGRGADHYHPSDLSDGDFNIIKVSHNQGNASMTSLTLEGNASMTSLTLDGPDRDCTDLVVNVRTDDEDDISEQSEHSDELLTEEMGNASFLSTTSKKSCVSFGVVRIHTHDITLGDNPAVSTGPPLELEWDHCASESYDVDYYEKMNEGACRSPKRISVSRREAMLREKGHSCSSFTRVSKEIESIQAMRKETKEEKRKEQKMHEYMVLANVSLREYRRVARQRANLSKDQDQTQEENVEEGTDRKATPSPYRKRGIFRLLMKK